MTRQLALVVAATCVIAAVTGDVQGTGAAPARGPAAVAPDRQVLGKYCFTCHNQRVKIGRARAQHAGSGEREHER